MSSRNYSILPQIHYKLKSGKKFLFLQICFLKKNSYRVKTRR